MAFWLIEQWKKLLRKNIFLFELIVFYQSDQLRYEITESIKRLYHFIQEYEKIDPSVYIHDYMFIFKRLKIKFILNEMK